MVINGVLSLVENENDDWLNSAQSYAEWMKTKWEQSTKIVVISVSLMLRSCPR